LNDRPIRKSCTNSRRSCVGAAGLNLKGAPFPPPREISPRNNSFEGMKDKSRPSKRRSYLALPIVFDQELEDPSSESP
jgi:hypothetical protein